MIPDGGRCESGVGGWGRWEEFAVFSGDFSRNISIYILERYTIYTVSELVSMFVKTKQIHNFL